MISFANTALAVGAAAALLTAVLPASAAGRLPSPSDGLNTRQRTDPAKPPAKPPASVESRESQAPATKPPPVEPRKESSQAPVKAAPAESRTPEEASQRAADPKDPMGSAIIAPPAR